MTKIQKHSVVYVSTDETNENAMYYNHLGLLDTKENVYVLTEAELQKFAVNAVWASCNKTNIDEFLKQNIEL